MNAYGGMLTVLTGVDSVKSIRPSRRARVVTIVGLTVVWYAIGKSISTSAVSTVFTSLTLMLYLLVPWTATNLMDFFFVRRGHYKIRDLFRPDGIYGAWAWRGLTAYVGRLRRRDPVHGPARHQRPQLHRAARQADRRRRHRVDRRPDRLRRPLLVADPLARRQGARSARARPSRSGSRLDERPAHRGAAAPRARGRADVARRRIEPRGRDQGLPVARRARRGEPVGGQPGQHLRRRRPLDVRPVRDPAHDAGARTPSARRSAACRRSTSTTR